MLMHEDLKETETTLVGHWNAAGVEPKADVVCQRVEWLVENRLEHVCLDASGMDLLLRDPGDGRLWERVYLESSANGHGPASLRLISPDRVKRKYTQFSLVGNR
jgi:Immunity protein 27